MNTWQQAGTLPLPAARTAFRRDLRSRSTPRVVRYGVTLELALLAGLVAETVLGTRGSAVDGFFSAIVFNAALVLAALLVLARGWRVSQERVPWLLLGSALLAWALGNVYWTLDVHLGAEPPFPSVADGFWLAFYPLAYVAVGLLVRHRVGAFAGHGWLDGLIGALVAASIAIAVVFAAVSDAASGSRSAVVVNLMYPLADAVLLAMLVATMAGAWRDYLWKLLTLGLLGFAITDSIYLHGVANQTYAAGDVVDLGWPLSFLLVAFAAWIPGREQAGRQIEGWQAVAMPSIFGGVALGMLVLDHFLRLNTIALVLVGLAVGLVLVRLALTFGDHLDTLRSSRREAVTDALTGLGNRRALLQDLESAVSAVEPRAFGLFDLDGFKRYNDTFGHSAGDALLARLGGNLAAAVGEHGSAYRLGGDEFCVLVSTAAADEVAARAATALSERGEYFDVTASCGFVALPLEADTTSGALRLADERMYAAKRRVPSAARATRTALLSALNERDPELEVHVDGVVVRAVQVGRLLGLGGEELEALQAGAELHDIGKVAVPDAILFKPGPLDPDELEFMRRHTIMGERIIAGVPSLDSVARLVRSSHERWDGTGYPDGLRGEEIPLGARIIAVCDAYSAMTTDRPYREAMTGEEALQELENNAGSQFDPAVVAAFRSTVATLLPPAPGGLLALARAAA